MKSVVGVIGMDSHSTEDFSCTKTILCDTTMLDTCPYAFIKTNKLYNNKN